MFRLFRKITALLIILAVLFVWSVVSDKQQLSEQVLRLHVVGASDSPEDQRVKLMVKDALIDSVQELMEQSGNKQDAYEALEPRLAQLEEIANQVLNRNGITDRATVTLLQEEFPARAYDTFTLPAGVYDSLRVTIGPGAGKNWWCVVFPSLCMPAASQAVEDVAAGAGFSDSLSGAITGKQEYQIRFFLLDWLGRAENFFHRN